jgi:hypothetical protein
MRKLNGGVETPRDIQNLPMPIKSRTNLSLRPEPKFEMYSFPGRNLLSFLSFMTVTIISK